MSDEDAEVSREHDGQSFEVELEGAEYRVRLVES